MTAKAATAPRSAATKRDETNAGRSRPRPADASAPLVRPSDLPREYRIAHVYRTLGGGLVAEYDAS
jgi:hypothetical protein